MGIEYNGGPRVLNGLTGATQTFAVASSGTDFGIASSGTAHTFSIPDAGASARGLVTTGTQTIAGAKTFSKLISTNEYLTFPTSVTTGWPSSGANVGNRYGLVSLTQDTAILNLSAAGELSLGGVSFPRLLINSTYLSVQTSGTWNLGTNATNALGSLACAAITASGPVIIRNGGTATTLQVTNTYTSGTSLELLQARGVASANFEIGPMKGSAGGTLRGLTIGGYATESAAITPWLTFDNAGVMTSSAGMYVGTATEYTHMGATTNSIIRAYSNSLGDHYSLIGDSTGSGGPMIFRIGSGGVVEWRSTTRSDAGSTDLAFGRDSAGVMGIYTDSTKATKANLTCGAITGGSAYLTGQTFLASNTATGTYDFTRTGDASPLLRLNQYGATTASRHVEVRGEGLIGLSEAGITKASFGQYGIRMTSGLSLTWTNSTSSTSTVIDLALLRDGAGTLAQRDGTNAQTSRVYNTYTSGTSFELIQARGVASANFELGPMKGSAGGTLRGLTIGGYATESASITPWLTFTNAGVASFASHVSIANGSGLSLTGDATDIQFVNASGLTTIRNVAGGSGIRFTNSTASGSAEWFRLSNSGHVTFTPIVSTGGSPTFFTLTGAAHTTLALSTEATDVNFNLARTVQFATGALTTQRAMRIQAPTYGFVGASTITTASTLSISGPPVAGTNATITNAYALNVESGNSFFAGSIFLTSTVSMAGNSNSTEFSTTGGRCGAFGNFGGSILGLGLVSGNAISWNSTSNSYSSGTVDISLFRDAAGILAQRSGATVQSFGVYGTWTSSTSYERVNIRGKASANFEIGPENGSAGGTLRGLTIGGYSAGSTTITPWLTFTNTGAATLTGSIGTEELIVNTTTTRKSMSLRINSDHSGSIWMYDGAVSPLILSTYDAGQVRMYSLGAYTFTGSSTNANTTTDTSISRSSAGVVQIGTTANNALGSLLLTNLTASGYVDATGTVFANGSNGIRITSRVYVTSPSDGVLTLFNNSLNNFDRLQLGGTTSSFPAIKRNAAAINIRLADDSAFAGLETGTQTITQVVSTSGSPTAFTLTGGAHTTLALSTEATDVNFNLARTVQFATGALTTQRAMRIQAPTYGFVGASTIGFVATLDVAPPIAGTNATFTASAAIRAKGAIALGDGTETTSTATSLDLYTNASTRSAYIKGGVNARGYLGQVFNNAAWSNDGLTIAGNSTTAAFQWVSNLQTDSWTITARLLSPSSGVVALSNGTTAQAFQVCGTYTSATSYELLEIKGKAGANFEIGPENGSAGGTLRGLTIGGYSAGSTTITPWLTFTNTGAATLVGSINIPGNSGYMGTGSNMYVYNSSDGFIIGSSVYAVSGNFAGMAVKDTFNMAWNSANNSYSGALDLVIGRKSASVLGIWTTPARTTLASLECAASTLTQVAATSGSPTFFTLTGAAHTTLALSTEATDINFNLARTVQFATGAITTQRAMRIQAPTYGFVGASTITTASTLSISGPPVAGTNATITNPWALNVESGNSFFGGVLYAHDSTSSASSLNGFRLSSAAYTGKHGLFSRYASSSEGWCLMSNNSGQIGGTINWAGPIVNQMIGFVSGSVASVNPDAFLWRIAANSLGLQNSTNAQNFSVHGTWTSTTSYERINVKGVASANFEIGPENGSAGGTLRGLTLGGYSAGSSTITPWLTFTSAGVPTVNQGTLVIPSGGTGLMCQQTNIYLDSYGTHSGIRYRRSEGTQGSPTGVAFNSLVGFVGTYGYHTGSAYHTTKGASIDFYATEAYTSGAQGTKIVFGTTPNGTTTNTVALTIDQNQVATFSKLVAQSAAEITSTPSGTTQTITLNDGNHQTLTLTSSTGAVTATLTVPSNVSSGTIIVKQHASVVRNITWAVSAGTIKWMGTQPTWSSDAVNDIRIVSWRYDGSVMYLMSTDKAA